MASAPPVTACAEHRRREAVARCSVCGAALCSECVVPTPVGIKCHDCTGTARPRAGRRPSRRRAGAVAVVMGGLLVAVAAYGLLGDDGADGGRVAQDVADRNLTGERRVRFDGVGGIDVSGTFTIPKAATAGPVPGVLILPGFGPTNRDGLVRAGAPDPLYRDLSQVLADSGLATLRYDKRGTGQTPLSADRPLRFDDLVGDARAGVSFLSERTEIRGGPLAVVGHEEGAVVALRLAAEDPRVKSVVLISAPGRPLVDVISDDFRNTHGQSSADAFRGVVEGLMATGSLPSREAMPAEHRDFFPEAHTGYLRDLFSLDPVGEAARVKVPVLIVRGARATGVSAVDSDRLTAAVGPGAEVLVGPDAGHTLALEAPQPPAASSQVERGGGHDHEGSSAAPGIRRDQGLLGQVSAWLGSRLAAR